MQVKDYINCLQVTVEQGLEPGSLAQVHALLTVLCHVTLVWERKPAGCSVLAFSAVESPKDSTGKPLYNLLNQIPISHEVERAITSGLKQLSRGAKGVQCETTPGEQTRWQHKTLPMPRKILQTLLML